jgi:hypothetical protein
MTPPDGSGWLCLKPIIQLDGDFTIDELRQIVTACDAAMGAQVVETVKLRQSESSVEVGTRVGLSITIGGERARQVFWMPEKTTRILESRDKD